MTEQADIHFRPGTGWHPEDVKAELRKRFGSLSAFSSTLGVSRQSISGVLANPLASVKLERQIAQALKMQPYAIWPARWRADGTPVPRSLRSGSVQIRHKKIGEKHR